MLFFSGFRALLSVPKSFYLFRTLDNKENCCMIVSVHFARRKELTFIIFDFILVSAQHSIAAQLTSRRAPAKSLKNSVHYVYIYTT